jgi:hypothetical protein
MTRRSALSVLILSFVTFGIYYLFWLVKTKDEMNEQGANIPTAFLLIIPFVNFYWFWKYAEGVETVTRERMSSVVALLVLWFLGLFAGPVLQDQFNRYEGLPEARLA